jgi:cathepsin F
MLTLLFILVGVTLSLSLPDSRQGVAIKSLQAEHWNQWKATHNKVYTAQEESIRFQNFLQSLQRIAKLNAKATSAKFGLNKFSDMSVSEFRSFYLLKNPIAMNETAADRKYLPVDKTQALPDKFDWREKGGVTAVKDQRQCGSCWAFSATENIESVWMLKNGRNASNMVPLSPQQIVDCDSYDGGCEGGNPPTAYQYVIEAKGMDTNADYPYTGVDGNCHFNAQKVYAKITNWAYACSYWQEDTLRASLVQNGAPSICVDAANWQDYVGGVMTGLECAWVNILDHCVQAVGYDMTASTPFWIVRNSWGTGWGENGYIRLEYGDNTCGLTNEASSAVA